MDQEDIISAFTKQEKMIKDCVQLYKAMADTSAETELEEVLNEFNNTKHECLRCLAAIVAMPAPEAGEKESSEDLYNQALENLSNNRTSRDNDTSSESESEADNDELIPNESILGDRSFVLSQVEGIPIDPITKTKIRIPARNTVCNHVYEHDVIISYLQQFLKRRRKKKVKCPYIGCSNGNVKMAHIVKDGELRQKIALECNDVGIDSASTSIVDIS